MPKWEWNSGHIHILLDELRNIHTQWANLEFGQYSYTFTQSIHFLLKLWVHFCKSGRWYWPRFCNPRSHPWGEHLADSLGFIIGFCKDSWESITTGNFCCKNIFVVRENLKKIQRIIIMVSTFLFTVSQHSLLLCTRWPYLWHRQVTHGKHVIAFCSVSNKSSVFTAIVHT